MNHLGHMDGNQETGPLQIGIKLNQKFGENIMRNLLSSGLCCFLLMVIAPSNVLGDVDGVFLSFNTRHGTRTLKIDNKEQVRNAHMWLEERGLFSIDYHKLGAVMPFIQLEFYEKKENTIRLLEHAEIYVTTNSTATPPFVTAEESKSFLNIFDWNWMETILSYL